MEQPRKAVALISGGLDSMLAAKVVLEQGVQIEGLNFFTGFCVEGHTHAIRRQDRAKPKRNNALWVAEQLGIKLHFVDVVEDYKPIVLNPRHGYGANINPCLDCKSFMVGRANEWRLERGFDFIVTGEVVGQRPKSQRRDTMPVVARESGAGTGSCARSARSASSPRCPNAKAGWIGNGSTTSTDVRASPRWRSRRSSDSPTMPSPRAAAAFLPTLSTRPSFPICGAAGAAGTTTSTTSCC